MFIIWPYYPALILWIFIFNQTKDASQKQAELYEHIKDSKSHYDAQTLDVATADQMEAMPIAEMDRETEAEPMEVDEEITMPEIDEQKVS